MLALLLFKQNLNFEAGQKAKEFVDIKWQIFSSELSEGASCQHPTPFLRQQAQHEELGGWREKNESIKLQECVKPVFSPRVRLKNPVLPCSFRDSLGLYFGRFC